MPPLSFLLTICVTIRQYQIKSPFWMRNRSLTAALLIITLLEVFEKWGLAVELFEANFHIIIVIGNIDDDYYLRAFLMNWYKIAHGLALLMPFLSALILVLIVGSYRQQASEHFRRYAIVDDDVGDVNVERMISCTQHTIAIEAHVSRVSYRYYCSIVSLRWKYSRGISD
ncbi:unnamed protein product [Acanthocheilonema viteae]|uniref:Uncharacterized protein n=1 Tax=Acanthocheilonema viteae TaxID=6277 RepID=A0A498SVH1_ACAVI|nr:unnamed protein product [Acanthocheilonema viteae]